MIYTVNVIGYGSGGEGVARLDDGRAVFIRNAARGDLLEIKLTQEQPRSARADIVRILAPSPHRMEPGCPAYRQCGGCDFRHITYDEELDAKLKRVNDAMERIGGLRARACNILRTGQTGGYRNKAVFHFDGASLGFYRPQSREVIPIGRCPLLKDELNEALRDIISSKSHESSQTLKLPSPISPFSADRLSQQPRDITLRSGRNGLDPPLEEELDGLVFKISGFFQVNTGAALLLYQKAREYAAMSKDESLADLYCGVGTLTLFIGRDAGYALGVELNSGAVGAARENALRNNLSHIEFITADATKWDADSLKPDCVVVDPPRKGLSPGTIRKIIELSPTRIVYVSCDPATLARDLRLLSNYAVKDICAVDMFPRTANVECCCLLERL